MLLMIGVTFVLAIGSASAATINVGSGAGNQSTTITGGITAAAAGDTVLVHTGTYIENVNINKANLNLTSTGTGTTTIQASNTANPVITVSATNTIINGFTITGSNTNGIQVNTNMNCQITNNNIYGNNQNGVNIAGGTSQVIINNNTIHENSGNTGSGYANILINGGTNTISNNIIYNVNGRGDDGIRIPGGTNTIYNNEIYGCEDGIDAEGGTNTITANILRNNREDGINIDNTITGLIISFNAIYGNTQHGIQKNVGGTLNAENNWWGHNTAPTSGTGTGTDIHSTSGAIDANPWLVLTLTSSPDTINIGSTSTITADFSRNSNGLVPTPPSTGYIFPRMPVTFTTTDIPALGSLNPTSTYINGLTAKATSIFTGTAAGLAHITATIGSYSQQVTVRIVNDITTIAVSNKLYSQLESITPIYGSEDYYYVTVKNTGTNIARNVVVSITMTPSLSAFNIIEWWVSWDNQVNYLRKDSSFNPTTGIWTVGDLAVGKKVYLDIRMIIRQTGAITNTATATADNAANVARAYTINVPTSPGSIDLSITNSYSTTNQRLLISVEQPSGTATDVTVNDGLPAGLNITQWQIRTGTGAWTTYTPGQTSPFDYWTGVWTIETLNSGTAGRKQLRIYFAAPPGTTEVISSVYGNQYDNYLANNLATITFTGASPLLATQSTSALTSPVTTFAAMSTTEESGSNDNLGTTSTVGELDTSNDNGTTSSGNDGTTTSDTGTQDNGLTQIISDFIQQLIEALENTVNTVSAVL